MPDSIQQVFFDSNTLLYLAGDDAAKASRTEALIRRKGVISVQVLNEIANVARRKMRLTWDATDELISTFRDWFEIVPVTLEVHQEGLRVARRYSLSVYDGTIIAAALEAGCTKLYSEDMHHGLVVDGQLLIENPFRSD